MGWELREARVAAGLTLAQVARAAGTTASNLSAYETGAKRPQPDTVDRVMAMIGVGPHSAIHRQTMHTFPALAALIRAGLKKEWTTADCLRVIRSAIASTKWLATANEWDAFLAKPSTTGDQRWDTMLAGVAELLADQEGHTAPAWVDRSGLPCFWWPGDGDALRAYVFARSPFPLRRRGIMLDPADLDAV